MRWARPLGTLFGLAVLTILTGCATRVVEEQVYPPEAWGTGQSGKALRVRVVGNAPDTTMSCLAQSHAISNAIATIVNARTEREVQSMVAALPTQAQSARSTGQERDVCMQNLERLGPQGTTQADLLRVMNTVAIGLGAPGPFATVAEARAYLSHETQ